MSRPLLLATTIVCLFLASCENNTATKNMKTKKTTNSEKTVHRVLVVLTSHSQLGNTGKPTGFFLSEVTHPLDVFVTAGMAVDFVSPKGGIAPMDGVDRADATNLRFLKSPDFMHQMQNTEVPERINIEEYDAIFFAGGHGTMWDLPNNTTLQKLTTEMHQQGGIVAAVCHGPAGLVNVRTGTGEYLVKGHRVASFTNSEERAVGLTGIVPFLLEDTLREHGAQMVVVEDFKKNVVVSERLVTGQNPASARGVAEAVVRLLNAQ